jgi:hypothetical protein
MISFSCITASCITAIFSRQLRMSRNYNDLALPGILRRRYFFIAIFQFLQCRE